MKNKFIPAIIILFVVISVVIYLLHSSNASYSLPLLMGGNTMMLALGFISFLMIRDKAGSRAQTFVNGVNSASLLKMMVCIISLVIYVFLNKKQLYKPSLFVLFGIYIAYTFVETILLAKIVREEK
ncbi:hypothetical protein ACTHGU_07945 [Chitinophagaceae bacterium MMS25-I14]